MRRRTTRTWIATLALLAVPLLAPATPVEATTTDRVLAITQATANPRVAFQGFDGNPPKVFDINGDGKLEIIVQNDNQWVYVFDSVDGNLLAEVKTTFPPGWQARSFNGPEVMVMAEDGRVKLILANSAATITSYRFEPSQSGPSSFRFTKEWERRLTDCHSNPGMDAKPVLADLNKDGRFEILAATEESGIYALRHDGSLYWKTCIAGGNGEPAVGDLDLDGWPDVVYASDGGHVTALQGRTGATMWILWVPGRYNVGAGSIPVGPAIGQLDGVGGPDIVVGVRDSHDATNWGNDHALLLALKSNGQVLWARQHPQANPLTYTRPIIADADGDGTNEVYWGDWNTNGHKPPWNAEDAWQRLGPGHFYRYSNTGALVWRQTLDTWWSNKDLVIADVDGDGAQEVVANGPSGSHDGLWYLNVATGAKEAFVDVHPWKVQRAPIAADLWGTGTMQLVVPAAPNAAGSGGHAILVYDTHAPYNAVWPHVPYPQRGAPSGHFDATFRLHNPGQWWQQVQVIPATARTIVDVDVRISDGPWRGMSLASWGHWTSSYHTPAGTRVEFLATDSAGRTSRSAPFTWLDGDLENPNVPPGSGGPPFSAGFDVSPNVNEWWVEVTVTASEPLAAVAVRVEGGSWTNLPATDWGSWARSMHVPRGSTVEFRATSTQGSVAISDPIQWLGGGSGFAADFEPSPNVNNWWVEVWVEANRPVASVSASVNGGSWTALEHKSWGSWAKSFHVPSGAEVRFRAADGSGNTATSGPFTWS